MDCKGGVSWVGFRVEHRSADCIGLQRRRIRNRALVGCFMQAATKPDDEVLVAVVGFRSPCRASSSAGIFLFALRLFLRRSDLIALGHEPLALQRWPLIGPVLARGQLDIG